MSPQVLEMRKPYQPGNGYRNRRTEKRRDFARTSIRTMRAVHTQLLPEWWTPRRFWNGL